MDAKSRAIDISGKLQAVHSVVGESAELDALHASMKAGLDENAGKLGLSAADLAEIDQAGADARARDGGVPKNPPQAE